MWHIYVFLMRSGTKSLLRCCLIRWMWTKKYVPIGFFENEDTLSWNYSKNKVYNIRSMKREAIKLKDKSESFDSSSNKSWWKLMWALNILQKIRNFIYKICQNWIPTNYILSKTVIHIDYFYSKCIPNLTSPSLWTCPSVKEIWKRCSYYYKLKI